MLTNGTSDSFAFFLLPENRPFLRVLASLSITFSELFENTIFKFPRCFASAITWGVAHKRKIAHQKLKKRIV